MDFARRQLLKYGWQDGKGLGKNESGIAEALKPKLKFDTAGVGHDSSEQYTFNWWENVYNKAADNIDVVKLGDGNISVKRNDEESVDITTKKYSYKNMKKKNNLEYGSFLKTSTLTPRGIEDYENEITVTTSELVENVKLANLTDEELFAACGGRTAHKGARHGLKLNGKLARIEEQEMLLLKKMKKEANNMKMEEDALENNYRFIESKPYKKKKPKTEVYSYETETGAEVNINKKRKHSQTENDVEIDSDTTNKKKEKRKKKKLRKRVSKLTIMLENVCVSSQQENKDDGFEEKSKVVEDESMKRKRKKKKHNSEVVKTNEKDDGFEEYISEVNEKLMYYKELRKDLQEEKRKGDEKRISKMAKEFERKL